MFCLLPFMLLGADVCTQKKKESKFYVVGFAASIALLIMEAFTLRHFGQESVSFIVFTLPTGYFLLHLVLNIEITSKWNAYHMLSAASLMMYLIHPLIIELFGTIIKSTIPLFAVTTVLATVCGICYAKAVTMQRRRICAE